MKSDASFMISGGSNAVFMISGGLHGVDILEVETGAEPSGGVQSTGESILELNISFEWEEEEGEISASLSCVLKVASVLQATRPAGPS